MATWTAIGKDSYRRLLDGHMDHNSLDSYKRLLDSHMDRKRYR